MALVFFTASTGSSRAFSTPSMVTSTSAVMPESIFLSLERHTLAEYAPSVPVGSTSVTVPV